MTLSKTSLEWAIKFITDHSDGDLFPRMIEIPAVATQPTFVDTIAGKPLAQFAPGASRRFVVPKDTLSYRQATQLNPQDTIILAALIYEFGQGIEDRRLPRNQVFSYRFAPTTQHGLYDSQNAWNDFWKSARQKSRPGQHIVYCDISDFYNQIYHHTLENQLIASNFPNQAIQWTKNLLQSTTAGVSRGVPVGPHAVHLLAESTLIPIDNTMTSEGFDFIRYADDILIFCNSDQEARRRLLRLARIMDTQQRLTLQRHKSTILTHGGLSKLSQSMIEDRPINPDEENLLSIIRKYAGGNPYAIVSFNTISSDDWKTITATTIEGIIRDYVAKPDVDFLRLRWLYRRLTQIGHPGAIQVSLDLLDELKPCIGSIFIYFASIQGIDSSEWKSIGDRLAAILDGDVVDDEYSRLSILSLFSKNSAINHFSRLASKFQNSDAYARREIILAAYSNGAEDWARGLKESYSSMDPWQRRALMYCASKWPADEKRYFVQQQDLDRPFDVALGQWARS